MPPKKRSNIIAFAPSIEKLAAVASPNGDDDEGDVVFVKRRIQVKAAGPSVTGADEPSQRPGRQTADPVPGEPSNAGNAHEPAHHHHHPTHRGLNDSGNTNKPTDGTRKRLPCPTTQEHKKPPEMPPPLPFDIDWENHCSLQKESAVPMRVSLGFDLDAYVRDSIAKEDELFHEEDELSCEEEGEGTSGPPPDSPSPQSKDIPDVVGPCSDTASRGRRRERRRLNPKRRAKAAGEETSRGADMLIPRGVEADVHVSATLESTRKGAQQSRAHIRRRNGRNLKRAAEGYRVRPEVREKLAGECEPVETGFKTTSLPAASSGYIGKPRDESEVHGLPELRLETLIQDAGYQYVEWNGRDPRPICDNQNRVFAVLAGQPPGENWTASCEKAYQLLVSQKEAVRFSKKELYHHRGYFPAVNVGVTHGMGTKEPMKLKAQPELAERLLNSPDFMRIATYASHSFQVWAPNLFKYYAEHLEPLFAHSNHLTRIFPKCVFPQAAFNFGPQVYTFRHRDSMNCPFGWCAIQALGKFDAQKGGHLVLDNLRLVIEFPANSLILIPSATLMHSNIPISAGEERASFTLYCPGGLFRWVDCGFMTEKKLEVKDPAAYAEFMEQKKGRLRMGLGLFSTVANLVKRR